MGRAPCCEKMGLKKGPWTPEEDLILISHINNFGHFNWRALPKQAGLLRCGKSCRLRWTNYLRPDIKRGNFTKEEEDTIINLHEMLGNRWSVIAAKLPGRTDNEIKNVWHTHLKKRLSQDQQNKPDPKRHKKQAKLNVDASKSNQDAEQEQQKSVNFDINVIKEEEIRPLSPPQCSSSDISSLTTSATNNEMSTNNDDNSPENDLALDEEFWSEVLSSDNSGDIPAMDVEDQFELPSPLVGDDDMDFWYDVYARTEELNELLEL